MSPIKRPHYFTNSYTYQFLKKVIFVPHCSIALRLSSLEWEKMYLLTYAWLMAKHYNTQNDSASLPVLLR